ncbi:Zn(2)-C6 fungal-type domain-containing protein [Fusarium falciforme]|uniref:Zn(2)-C6 fungal-type domain-containing protein n=1 Tax=Fusarium falciforme TaxID=195108 RepID=UPI0023015B37|nr:Zn(2)-C6 fungal-type domain-containing protein [Fusarium falciforme]WAO91632.1 Zn(2)-C6 fungal-type domain-containing protein [Fusarium falciforme]
MASRQASRQACRLCRRRKVKCDGFTTCRNCDIAKTTCQYSPPKKRGPKPVKWQDAHPQVPRCSASPDTHSSRGAESPAPLAETNAPSCPTSDSPLSSTVTANPLIETPETQTETAASVHLGLLAGLLAATPSQTAASIANDCILLYTRYVFGSTPVCHEATVRATVHRFFIPLSDGDSPADDYERVLRCFAADTERERIEALRSITLLIALCAAVTYVVPESLLPSKYLTAPLFLRAARDTLRIYEDYDLEHPNSSSLSIRLFLSSAIQTASGTHGVAFHILSEAGLIAMRMGLYHESALEGRDALEETLLRNAFWQLYVCDKTALVMKGRPVTIHETLFEGGLTIKAHSSSPVPLFDPGGESSDAGIEDRLAEGFHVICRLWAMAARVIQGMESLSSKVSDAFNGMMACRESITQLSEAYFEMITLTNNLPVLFRSPAESSPDMNQDVDKYMFQVLQRQRTSYLITLHIIKVLVLHSAIQCKTTEVIGLSADPLTLAMRQIEQAQDFLNALESVPFLHLQAEGEHCVSGPEESHCTNTRLHEVVGLRLRRSEESGAFCLNWHTIQRVMSSSPRRINVPCA